jgi:hypothetical protein
MKKIIKLTESDLTNLIRKVIEEQTKQVSKPQTFDKKALQYFIMNMNQGGRDYYQRWVLDPNNPRKRGNNLVLTGKEGIAFPTELANKPLVWSLLKQGKKEKDAYFEFFKDDKGTIYYNCSSDTLALCKTDDGQSGPCKSAINKVLTSSNAQEAVDFFNGRVQFREVMG